MNHDIFSKGDERKIKWNKIKACWNVTLSLHRNFSFLFFSFHSLLSANTPADYSESTFCAHCSNFHAIFNWFWLFLSFAITFDQWVCLCVSVCLSAGARGNMTNEWTSSSGFCLFPAWILLKFFCFFLSCFFYYFIIIKWNSIHSMSNYPCEIFLAFDFELAILRTFFFLLFS